MIGPEAFGCTWMAAEDLPDGAAVLVHGPGGPRVVVRPVVVIAGARRVSFTGWAWPGPHELRVRLARGQLVAVVGIWRGRLLPVEVADRCTVAGCGGLVAGWRIDRRTGDRAGLCAGHMATTRPTARHHLAARRVEV